MQNVGRVMRAFLWSLVLLSGVLMAAPAYSQGASEKEPLAMLLYYYHEREVCVGQPETYGLLVHDLKPSPVSGVVVDTNYGYPALTGANGSAELTVKIDKEGVHTVRFTAKHPKYQDAKPVETKVKAVNCTYQLRMDYSESMQDQATTWVLEGSVEIPPVRFKVDEYGDLALSNGSSQFPAEYTTSMYDMVEPVYCRPDPYLGGEFQIQFEGAYSNESLNISLTGETIQMPPKVKIKCELESKEYEVRTWEYFSNVTLDFIQQAGLSSLKITNQGTVRKFKFDRLLLLAGKPPTFASGVLLVERISPRVSKPNRSR